MARRGMVRASDAEREQVAERLRHATAEGRLLAEELEERLGLALGARTQGELDALVADLPRTANGRRARVRLTPWSAPAFALALAAAMLAVVVLAAIALVLMGFFVLWVLWLAWGWWLFGRHRGVRYHHRRVYGPRRPIRF